MNLLKQDLNRYRNFETGKFEWYEPSFINVIIYRWGRSIRSIKFKPLRVLINIIYTPVFMFFSLLMGIHIPRGAKIGPGLKIHHFNGIIINPLVIMGSNCTLRQGETFFREKTIPFLVLHFWQILILLYQ